MNYTTTEYGNVTAIAPEGKLTYAGGTDAMRKVVADALARGIRAFVIDLTSVTHVDSTGLGALITLHTMTRNAEAHLCFAGLNEQVAKLMKLTQLDTIVAIYPTLAKGVAAVGRHQAEN